MTYLSRFQQDRTNLCRPAVYRNGGFGITASNNASVICCSTSIVIRSSAALCCPASRSVQELQDANFASLVQLGETLRAWSQEIAAMWRFTRNNGITEGFHNKMETISRQAFGFRNFENYRLRIKVLCG